MRKVLTLCIINQGNQILLGMKKRGFGQGRWNGFGGKVMPNEEIEDAARREIFEEAGIKVPELEKAGIIEFKFQGNPEILEVHIFKAGVFYGNPSESEEMKPQWFDIGEIPFEEMWPDDKRWLPLFLDNKKFRGRFLFDESGKNIVKEKLVEVRDI